MLWFRFQASFIGRRRFLWAAGGLAGVLLVGLILAGSVDFLFLPIAVGAALLFGMLQSRSCFVPTSRWHGLDYVPGTLVGALSTWPLWSHEPIQATFLALMGSMAGLLAWALLPTTPNMTEAHLRAIVNQLVLHAHAKGAPVTQVAFHPYMTGSYEVLITLAAKGDVSLYEEPLWWTIRVAFNHPTVLPTRFTEALYNAFPDGVLWTMPTSAHGRLAHAGRVAASQANSIFGPMPTL